MTIADSILPPNQVADAHSTPDKKQIRAGLLMLLFMTTAFGAATWNAMQDLAIQLRALPVVLFVIVCVLVARLYNKVDGIVAASDLETPERSVTALPGITLAHVPLDTCKAIWGYWDKNGTGREKVEYIKRTHRLPANVVQHLLERYDVKWREQVALLFCDNPLNEYTVLIGIDENQIAEDALRLKSGLPIHPAAGVWWCSDCRKRPCRCDSNQPGRVQRMDGGAGDNPYSALFKWLPRSARGR